jgi:glycine oxidase
LLDIKDTIYPIKGQMIVIKAKVGMVEHIILDQGRYIIPRKDGRLLIGDICTTGRSKTCPVMFYIGIL